MRAVRIVPVRYVVRHHHQGHEVVSAPAEARLIVEAAFALAAAGRRVVVTDEHGRAVDLEGLVEQVTRATER